MAYDVKVKIDVTKPTGKTGFGFPLILEELTSTQSAIPYTECANLQEIAEVGYETTSDVYKTAELIFMQDNAPEKVAVCSVTDGAEKFLSNSENVSRNWRQLLVLFADYSQNTIATVAAKVEALDYKMYFANVESDDKTYIGASKLNYDKTVLLYCDATSEYVMPVAALVGETAGRKPGSFSYKNRILKGVQPQMLSDSQIETIHKNGGITVVSKNNKTVTSEGIVTSGEYTDIVDGKDYIIKEMVYRIQELLISADKVPYDNRGISMLEAVAINVLRKAYNNDLIAETADGNADYTVTFGKREETAEADRSKRNYIEGKFSFALAGAIHTVEITVKITL